MSPSTCSSWTESNCWGAVRAPARGAREARRRAAIGARARPGRRGALARCHRGRRRQAPRRRLRPGKAHGDGQGQAPAHARLRRDGLQAGREPETVGSIILGLYDSTGRFGRSATALLSQRSASASCARSSRRLRPALAAAARRAAGPPTASSSGWSFGPNSLSRSATTMSATGASATARRSFAGATTSRRASARSTSCADNGAQPASGTV